MKYFTLNNKALAFITRILLGSVIVWWSLYYLHDNKKVWALISVIVVSDPDFNAVRLTVIARVVNTIMGCLLGLLFIYLLGVTIWSLLCAIAVSVLLSTSFKKYPSSWKLAPVTVVIVMTPSVVENALPDQAISIALIRTAEVLYGSLVAFVLGFVFLAINKKFRKQKDSLVTGPQTEDGQTHD
ncbi:MAG TPA: FUSC family protein [Bacteroidia bacterium]|jgi:uncharacterized membrane protein YccC|nr:FUSC family protein [Bacteroidia bacterium]